MKNPIIVIAGPTASGKTALAVHLAKKLGGEVINADSRSIYREMDLGTGKPTTEEREGIPHHLFDIADPDEQFSVAEYKKLAEEKIKEIAGRGKIPIIAGGTMMYIDAVIYNYEMSDTKPNQKLRERLAQKSTEEIFSELQKADSRTAKMIDSHNRHRLIRALEIFYETGSPKASEKKKSLPKNVLYLALCEGFGAKAMKSPSSVIPAQAGIQKNKADSGQARMTKGNDRKQLYDRINKRADVWMKEGFVDEVKKLLEKYSLGDPGMNGIGYKQVGLYLTGKISLKEATEKFKQGDRNLAKRQLTWLRRNKDVTWIKNKSEAEKAVKNFLGT